MHVNRIKNRVSVIVPTFNGENFLNALIANVFAQTYSDLELIIVVDASADNSISLIRKHQEIEPRIVIISNQVNLGASHCRNLGIGRATGEFLAFLDHDDLWHPEKLSKQISILKQDKTVFATLCDYVICKRENDTLYAVGAFRYTNVQDMYERWLNIKGDGPLLPSTLVVRNTSKTPKFNFNLRALYDIEYLSVLLEIGRIHKINEFLTAYLQHSHQMHRNPQSILEIENLTVSSQYDKTFLSRKAIIYSKILTNRQRVKISFFTGIKILDYVTALTVLFNVFKRRYSRKFYMFRYQRGIEEFISLL
jgi:glycosyltransferase involved in cell wall biosynthesis